MEELVDTNVAPFPETFEFTSTSDPIQNDDIGEPEKTSNMESPKTEGELVQKTDIVVEEHPKVEEPPKTDEIPKTEENLKEEKTVEVECLKTEEPLKTEESQNINSPINDCPKTEEPVQKPIKHSKRPNSVSETNRRKKTSREERETNSVCGMTNNSNLKNSSKRKSVSVSTVTSTNSNKKNEQPIGKSNTKIKTRKSPAAKSVDDVESSRLLFVAGQEQKQITEILRIAREEFWKNIGAGAKRPKEKKWKVVLGDHKSASILPPAECGSYPNTDNCLDEIFHVWMNLFYFIMNLKINLIKIVRSTGIDNFKPHTEAEKEIITRAIECVKLFSKLKMKYVVDSLEESRNVKDFKKAQMEVIEYRDQVLSKFLLEMDYMRKKAFEVVAHTRAASRE